MNKNKYINYIHQKFLYTNDGWKTILISKDDSIPSNCILEKNSKKVFEAKIKYEYGLKVGAFIIRELKRIAKIRESILGEKNNHNGYGDEFEIFSMCVLHNLEPEEVIQKYLVHGSDDGKIDAVYYETETNNCYIYQIKLSIISDDVVDKMKENIDLYRQNKLQTKPNCSDLLAFLNKMPKRIDSFHIEYKTISSNGRNDNNILPAYIFSKFIERKTTANHLPNKMILKLESSLNDLKTFAVSTDQKILFTFVNAEKLLESILCCVGQNNIDDIFADNVRGDLGKDDEMMDTIINHPKNFCSFNNGISITGHFSIPNKSDSSYIFEISTVNIINGQQTIFNLLKAKEEGINVDKILVPLFIKEFINIEEQSKIAKYNNTQKTVSAIDLLSIDQNLKELQVKLIYANDNGKHRPHYLDIVTSGKKRWSKNARSIYGKRNVIKLSDFVKLYSVIYNPEKLGAWKNNFNKEVDEAYRNGFPVCELSIAHKIIDSIVLSKDIIADNRTKYAIADLAIQYLLFIGLTKEEAVLVIEKTTNKYSGSYKKNADIYKSKSAYSNIYHFIPKKYKKL